MHLAAGKVWLYLFHTPSPSTGVVSDVSETNLESLLRHCCVEVPSVYTPDKASVCKMLRVEQEAWNPADRQHICPHTAAFAYFSSGMLTLKTCHSQALPAINLSRIHL